MQVKSLIKGDPNKIITRENPNDSCGGGKHIKVEDLRSNVEIRSDTLDIEQRTVEVCWTTGAAVKRWSWDEGFYIEELAVDEQSIRLGRFNAMPLVDTHETHSMATRLGTVVPGSVRIEDGRGYATIKLSRKPEAEVILQDLQDGHPLAISVGYRVHAYLKTEGEGDKLPVFRAVDWEPLELSAVPVPADPEAVSRSEPAAGKFQIVPVLGSGETSRGNDEVIPMNKRDLAKSYNGSTLTAFAMGLNVSRLADETDEQLRVRVLEAIDAAEAAEAAAADDGEAAPVNRAAPANAQEPTPVVTQPAPAQQAAMTSEAIRNAVNEGIADERTRSDAIHSAARMARVDMDSDLVVTAIRNGTSVAAFREQLFEHMVSDEMRTNTFAPAMVTHDQRDKTRTVIVNSILHRNNLTDTLLDGANQWRNMSSLDLIKELLRDRGESTRGMSVHEVVQRGLMSTSDFPIIMGDVTRQTLLAGYTSYENTFQLFANRNIVTDFREAKVIDVGNAPDLELVNENGEFKRGKIRESAEGISIATYGKILGLTRQMIINDHLGAFTRLISNWGMKAAKLEGDLVWNVIIKNRAMADGKALFSSDHRNLGAAADLDQASLELNHTAFRKQKDIDGEPINIPAKFLFVGSDNELTAQKLIAGVTMPSTPAQVVPQVIKGLQPVYEYRIDALPKKDWFLFADQAATMGRGIQYAYLSGQETPFTEENIGFNVDGIEYKIRHDFGAGATDFRFGRKIPGK